MKKNNRKNKDGGYAILFAVVIVGIISMITIGLSNAAYKQLILSSVVRDSTTAFYQADIGSECALYVDTNYQDKMSELEPGQPEFLCAGKPMKFSPSETVLGKYELKLDNDNASTQCFRITINKTIAPDGSNTTEISSRGYNICKKSNSRTVERGIRVFYGGGDVQPEPIL